ncbi:MAG TPA: alpha/beta hydrolase [Pyrinomonadaceae bacterium]|nr:alpha/beta hydrolase [Pyrinomonadaceae bacterium]
MKNCKSLIWQTIFTCSLLITSAQITHSQSFTGTTKPTSVIDVWTPGKMPGNAVSEPEADMPDKGDNVQRITNISHPTLSLFPARIKNSPAVIVCPGGGYSYVTYNKEGVEVAEWLNSLGITALVLKYRTPKNRDGAFQDLQRSISLTRENAKKWSINAKKIGVIGFSAGGHLAAKASNLFETRSYALIDSIDKKSARPDFVILVYPAYLERDGKIVGELNLKAKIPQTLIVHNEDDKTFILGSKIYNTALDEAKIKHTFLLYQTGGHGYGLRSDKEAGRWTKDAAEWIKNNVLR